MGNGSSEGNQSAEEIATAEIDRYIVESAEKLNSKQPLLWWKLQVSSYKYLSHLLKKYLVLQLRNVKLYGFVDFCTLESSLAISFICTKHLECISTVILMLYLG